ncbi:MAG: hypothetical protein AAB505_02600 [Patescibacteria group bacterium]
MNKNDVTKLILGLVILVFSTTFAYFTARYLRTSGTFGYWPTLTMFSIGYILLGVICAKIYPVSLGFLFASVILLLHNLSDNFDEFASIHKTIIVGFALVVLYIFAWHKLKDPLENNQPVQPVQ